MRVRTTFELRTAASVATAALAGVLAACAPPALHCGPGTHLEGQACVPDGADGGVPRADGDAPPSDGPSGDGELRLFDGSSEALVVDGLRCLQLDILHTDGSRELVGSDAPPEAIEVTTGDPAVAIAAQPGDCPRNYAGIIGVSAGRTTAQVTLTRGGRAMHALASIEVAADAAQLVASDAQVVAGGQTDFPGASLSSRDPAGAVRAGGGTVGRWTTFTIADTSLATITAGDGGLVLHGLARGATTVVATYRAPHGTLTSAPADIHVLAGMPAGDPYVGLSRTNYTTQASGTAVVRPGECWRRGLFQSYYDMGRSYELPVEGGTFTLTGDALRTGATPDELCYAHRGVFTLQGCEGARCSTLYGMAWEEGYVRAVTLDGLPTTPLLAHRDTTTDWSACAPLQIHAMYADGTGADLTADPRLYWNVRAAPIDTPVGGIEVTAPSINAAGERCFGVIGELDPSRTYDVSGSVQLDGTATTFRFQFVRGG